jgi:hypothetical protein
MKSVLGGSPEMWAVRSAPDMLYSADCSNLLESIISMVKVSKTPSVAVQERLKLSAVMSETFKLPISGSLAEKGRGGREETNKFELIIWLCMRIEGVNRTISGEEDWTVQGYGERKQCY